MREKQSAKLTIDELEEILNSEQDVAIEILPNGEIRKSKERRSNIKRVPLAMRENLGGEYAVI